jgi:hypothetical protein
MKSEHPHWAALTEPAAWTDVMVDATRRFNNREERAKVAGKMRENAGPKQRQTMLLDHLDDLPGQQTIFGE